MRERRKLKGVSFLWRGMKWLICWLGVCSVYLVFYFGKSLEPLVPIGSALLHHISYILLHFLSSRGEDLRVIWYGFMITLCRSFTSLSFAL